jgi:hypothetical protein
LPADVVATAALWKVFGTGATDAWLVGSNGVSLHWDGAAFARGDTGVGSSLFTVHASGGRYAAVGGLATGVIVELDGNDWLDVTPDPPPLSLSGVCLAGGEAGMAVGMLGTVYVRTGAGWTEEPTGFYLNESLHGAWIDGEGGLWAVGGRTASAPLIRGVLVHRGDPVAAGGLE